MSVRLSGMTYEGLRELITSRLGIVVPSEGPQGLERKLLPLIRRNRFAGFSEFELHLRYGTGNENAWAELIEAVTIHETHFFRSPEQFVTLEQDVIPRILNTARRRSLRVWSVACSTGEEAYSLAILLDRMPLLRGYEKNVVGTDISRSSVRTARRGVYGQNSFRNVTPAQLSPYVHSTQMRPSFFVPAHEPSMLWEVSSEVRSLCTFAVANVLEPSEVPFQQVDLVVCRNLLIYFDERARGRVLKLIGERLAPGGILLLGPVESLLPGTTDFELVPLQSELVYRKPA
jgi:chemotaxis protein methyltransferase CheR